MLSNHAYSLSGSQAHKPRRMTTKKFILVLLVSVTLAACVPMVVIDQWPDAAAQGANSLRAIFGVRFVAQLETFVFTAKDAFQRLNYQTGLKKPAAPWWTSATEQSVPLPAAPAPITSVSFLVASPHSQPAAGSAPMPVSAAGQDPAARSPNPDCREYLATNRCQTVRRAPRGGHLAVVHTEWVRAGAGL